MGKGDRKTRKGKRFINSPRKKVKLGFSKSKGNKMDYKLEMQYAVKNNIVKLSDIFDFEDTPYEKFYSDLFKFCRENLDIHFAEKSISRSLFLFSNNFNINAKAGVKNNHNVILINIGLMQHCIEKYFFNVKLNDYIEKKWTEIASQLDSSVSYLAFQVNTHFTYYHELAHLFQLSKLETDRGLQERGSNNEFDMTKHKLEINADTYSAISIATHIHQYIEKSFKEINQNKVENTIAIFGACLLEYIISFTDSFELYYDKKSHPHPIIRMLNLVMNITYHLSLIPIYTEKGIALNPISLFRHIIDLHGELESQDIFTSGFSNFINNQTIDIKNTTSYLDQIRNLDSNAEYIDAMHVWNSHVQSNT